MQWLFSSLIITIFFIVYAVVHSLLASFMVKNWGRRIFGPGVERWYRLVYNILAVLTLLPLGPMLAVLPAQTLYLAPAPWHWLMLAGQLLALSGLGLAFLHTGPWHFLGLAQLLGQQSNQSGELSRRGCYGWMRHPLYTFSMLFLWLSPIMTTNLLTVNLIFTLYFYIGSIFEERRLLAEFGPVYREYQQQVSRFIPMKLRAR
jgi:protein-S-isoprenylcysteine O-methyltransferase Ste14